MNRRTHIIGAGLAGLSAAIRLTEAGHRVVLYEAGPQAGGRCRSYFDEALGCRIDNGNHLLLSSNRAALAYLAMTGAGESLTGPVEARFPFIDLTTGQRWVLAPGRGVLPFWLLDRRRRVPDTRVRDYLGGLRLRSAGVDDTVAALLAVNPVLYRRFWEPLAVAVLNTAAHEGAARLLWPVIRESFARGSDSCRPLVARIGLSESFVDPAQAWLAARGAVLLTGSRIRAIDFAGGRAVALEQPGERIALPPGDSVVLAVPPMIAAGLVPNLTVPGAFRPILNAHYRLPGPATETLEIVGVIGGHAEWVFRRNGLASVTVSAATRLIDEPAETLAPLLWADVAVALGLPRTPLPPWRIVKEKRATFAQTPAQLALRPGAVTRWTNLVLAGDWTDTGLPATIEGAIRSGETAARVLLGGSVSGTPAFQLR